MKIKVRLNTVGNAVLFSAKCSEYECDIDYSYDRQIIDAKSLIGIIGIGLERTCTVEIRCENEEVINRFRKDMELWIIEE